MVRLSMYVVRLRCEGSCSAHTHIHLMFMKMDQGNRLVLLVMAESEHENCSSGVCPDVGCKVRNWIRRSAGFYWLEFMT